LIYILDTDHLSILEYGGAESITLQSRLDRIEGGEVATTIITYEEQMRGWLARAAAADTTEKMRRAYSRLKTHIETFAGIPILGFDDAAIEQFTRLRQSRIRIGTMDLKIAAIALANGAVLLTRNSIDFANVLKLSTEDWTR
jgi:tRNA(fMet)-specific endonuclease VapC